MNYTSMTSKEIRDVIEDLVLEIKKAAYSDDLNLVIMVNGREGRGWFRIVDGRKGEMW